MATDAKDYAFRVTNKSFGGCDIRAMIGGVEFANLQGISWTVTREKAPIYVMGRTNPVGFARGKRGIAGSMVGVNIDQDALLGVLWNANDNPILVPQWPEEQRDDHVTPEDRNYIRSQDPESLDTIRANEILSRQRSQWPVQYIDQLPSFDILIQGDNEAGAVSSMVIVGVENLNAGSGTSVDDITINTNITFVASDILPLRRVVGPDKDYVRLENQLTGAGMKI